MNAFLLTAYILAWPVVCTVILVILVVAAIKDYRTARRNGEDVV